MFKAKRKLISLLTACMALVLMLVMGITTLSIQPKVASAADTTIEFTLGANGSASHSDGSSKTSYSETVSGYTLSLTNVSNFYTGARDAKGNSCIKLGASSKTGGFSFTVPNDVTSAVIAVAGYKANTVTVKVNNVSTSVKTTSNNGAYTDITVDTSSTKTVTLVTATGYRAMVNSITFVIPAAAGACEHANTTTTTTDATCTEAGSTVVTCDDCGETVSTTPIAATGHKLGDNVEYTREGDKHTKTGPCIICGDSATETENCTLSYENVSNDDGTHNMTSTCSVCKQSSESEVVACTFDKVLDGVMLTYTCQYCEYSYTEAVSTYTVTYVVPNGIEAVESVVVADGFTTTLPTAETKEDYTFVGWVTELLDEKTENAPEMLKAETEYTVTADTTLYALYSYAEGTGAFTLVTDASTLAVGKEIVIVASGENYALGTNQANNNRTAVAVTKNSDVVTWTTDVQVITLEEGFATGTWAFHVTGGTGTNAANGYLYAPASGNYLRTQTSLSNNSSWNISITSAGIATIKANVASGQNWLRKNSSSTLFSCYTSGQNDVSIYMKDGATYYMTEFNTCAHSNTEEVVEPATCTESGSRTVTCLDCESEIVSEILPALGHNYIDDVCENCDKVNPASIVYDGYYYLSINGKYAGEKDGNYYKLFDDEPATLDLNYVFYFVKNGETYDMYNMKAGKFAESVTIETQEDYTVQILNAEGRILSHNTGYQDYQRLGFYATSNSYPNNITLTAVEVVNIDSASVTLGDDVALNYYVTMSEGLEATMNFKMDGETYDRQLIEDGERYKVSLELPPQYMATEISVELIVNGVVVETMTYSIKQYAQNKLNEDGCTDELKRLVSDMLYYGAAAQVYRGYNVENLATADVTNLVGTPSTVNPEEADNVRMLTSHVAEKKASFKSVSVWFDDVNKIYVKVNTQNANGAAVTLKILKGETVEKEVVVTSETVFTEGILATDFDETYTFELSVDGELTQTLTYSVNAYAYKMKDHTDMSELALALYRYGKSAEAYKG